MQLLLTSVPVVSKSGFKAGQLSFHNLQVIVGKALGDIPFRMFDEAYKL